MRTSSLIQIALVLCLGGFDSAHAQIVYRGTDIGGVQPSRAYFSPTAFEAVDTKTGNLVLTFTDLVLPGYNGTTLVFQHTYNNDWVADPLDPLYTWRWHFGFPGIVMRVIERPWPTTDPLPWPEVEIANTPILVMGDGSIRRTRYQNAYIAGTGTAATDSQRHVTAAGFLKYNRTTRQLRMPDGTICEYDAQGRLTDIAEPFGSHVHLAYPTSTQIIVTQTLGTQVRTVTLERQNEFSLASMTYNGRQWVYQYGADAVSLEQISPPVGPEWTFGYQDGMVASVTTPGGGQIAYGYVDQSYSGGTVKVLSTRTTGGQGITDPGTWQFTLGTLVQFTQGQRLASFTEILMPSGRKLRYDNFSGSVGDLRMGSGTGFLTQTLYDSSGQWLEREERQYVALPLVSPDISDNHGPAEIAQQTFRRRDPSTGAELWRTLTYSYLTTYYADYHNPWAITESSSDGPPGQTLLGYTHRDWPAPGQTHFMVGLLASEQISIDSQVVSEKSWTYSDADWRLPTSADNGSATTTFGRDAFGNVASITAPNSTTTTFTYEWGQLKSSQGQEPGSVMSRVINPDGTAASETVAGRTTSYQYDNLGRVTLIQGPGVSNPITTAYDNVGAASVTTQRDTMTVTTLLDGFGRPHEIIDSAGVRTRIRYDADGRVRYRSYPFTPGAPGGNADIGTTITYDALDRVLRETQADGVYTEYTYGLTTTTVRDRTSDRVTVMTHGPHGVTQLVDPASSVWTYTYDDLGRLRVLGGPDGVSRTWDYGTDHRLSAESSPEAGTITYDVYDDAGLLKQKTDANNTTFVYAYDDNNRLETITAGTLTTTIGYETGSNNIETLSSGGVTTSIDWDDGGRPWHREDTLDGKVFATVYAYDANDSLVQVTYPSGRQVRYDYDAQGRLARVYDVGSGVNYATDFQYHGSGAWTGYTAGNGTTVATTLDPMRYRVERIQSGALDLTYDYYTDGNVQVIDDERPGTPTPPDMDQSFQYDLLDRLTRATGFYGDIPYAYDAHGNRQTAPEPGATVFTYHAGQPFHLQSINGVGNYQYDNNGNLKSGTAGGSFLYEYRPDNMMSTSVANGQTTHYGYDAEAARVKKATVGGATVYFGRGPDGRLLTEWTDTSPTAAARDYIYVGSRVIAAVTTTDLPPIGGGGGGGASAQLLSVDTATQGSWQGSYGLDGSIVIADAQNLPGYAQVTPSGYDTYTWEAATSDLRGLQRASNPATRLAATWYTSGTMRLDIGLTDGAAHDIAIYAVDWDNGDRVQRFDIRDASTGALLDSQTLSGFTGGQYLVWRVTGHVWIDVTHLGGFNAVISGVFFGDGGASAQLLSVDTATQGSWQGSYGLDGSIVIEDAQNLPGYAQVTPSGYDTYTWEAATSDLRGLQRASNPATRLAATWYTSGTMRLDIGLTDGAAHDIAIYAVDWDNGDRVQRFDIRDASTGALLDSQTLSAFTGGRYLVWRVSGHVWIDVTHLGGFNAVISGVFFDPPSP